MKNTVSVTGELLSDSQPVSDYDWPPDEPDLSATSLGVLNTSFRDELLRECSFYREFSAEDFLKSYGNQTPLEQAIALLNHHAFQFNSKKRFRNSDAVQQSVKESLENGASLDVVIPIFCVIGNKLKRFDPTVVTFAEECTLLALQRIADIFQRVVGLELRFQIISDALFYIRPLGSDPVVASLYYKELCDYVDNHKLSNLTIYDMSLLPSNRLEEFEDAYLRSVKLLREDPGHGLEEENHQSWLRSMASTITTRDIPATYKEIEQTFRNHDFSTPFGQEVLSRTRRAFVDYRALKYALNELHWDETHFPGSIRATIHQKKEPVLGLRVYPEYKRSSRLLPYHGVAVIKRGVDDNPVMEIVPEISVIGRERFKRFVLLTGSTDLYVDTTSIEL